MNTLHTADEMGSILLGNCYYLTKTCSSKFRHSGPVLQGEGCLCREPGAEGTGGHQCRQEWGALSSDTEENFRFSSAFSLHTFSKVQPQERGITSKSSWAETHSCRVQTSPKQKPSGAHTGILRWLQRDHARGKGTFSETKHRRLLFSHSNRQRKQSNVRESTKRSTLERQSKGWLKRVSLQNSVCRAWNLNVYHTP